VDIGGARTASWVAMRNERQLLGYITAYRQEAKPFSDKQIALLQNFASQAVIAMENARLITETREALEQQTATAEVLQVINSSPGDLTPVFDAILEKAHTLCGATLGSLRIFEGEYARSVAQRGHSAEFGDELRQRVPVSNVPAGLVRGEPLVHIPDITIIEAITPIQKASIAAGIRTLLMVPLRKDRTLLGYITAHRREVRPFSDKQIALLQNFAAQAVIAMENARLITETREALEQQTATAEVLGVINSSPGDLAPVFEVMLDRAICLCEAAYGVLWTYNGDGFRAATLHGVPQPYAASLSQEPTQFDRGTNTALGQIAAGSDFAHFDDVATEQGYMSSGARRLIELGGARTVMVVALRKDGKLLGAISAFRQEVCPFTDKQIALLKNFAAQAVIAMENARLITETREALEQQTATAEVLQVINSSPGDLAPVFDAMLKKALALCDAAYGHMLTSDGESFTAVAARGPAAIVDFFRDRPPTRPVPGTTMYRLVQGERFAQVADLAGEVAGRADPTRQALVDLAGARSAVSVGLRKDGALLGAMSLYRQEVRPFSDKQIALLQNFAAQAVIAMENARLITETREALEQQTATAEILGVINSSPGDLAPVFDAILETAMRLCGFGIGALETWDGAHVRAVATRGLTKEFDDLVRRGFEPQANDPIWSLVKGEPYVHVDDLGQVDEPTAKEAVARVGVRTFLGVALRKDELLLGRFVAVRQQVRPFTDKQIALLQNFAAQAVIAMENARLLGELRQRTDEVADLNRGLEARVAEQVEELGRVGRLKRFLAPQLAELIVSQGDEKILESHRREIVVVFCDLRGYTAFTETAEPEEVLDFLREYHGALGPLVSQFEGTLDQFSGDGIMVFFNDPVPIPDPAERAVKMAVAMREAAGMLIATWRRRGRLLGFGAGIAQGYATLGQIGFADRSGYTASNPVTASLNWNV
jgi:GAF domain-containing protein